MLDNFGHGNVILINNIVMIAIKRFGGLGESGLNSLFGIKLN